MKKLVLLFTLLLCSGAFANSIKCDQADGDTRYDLMYAKGTVVIMYTGDDDISHVKYIGPARYSKSKREILAANYKAKLDFREFEDSSLYVKVRGKVKNLTGILECKVSKSSDFAAWVNPYFAD